MERVEENQPALSKYLLEENSERNWNIVTSNKSEKEKELKFRKEERFFVRRLALVLLGIEK